MRGASLAVLVLLGSVAAAQAQVASAEECSVILGPDGCSVIVSPSTPAAPAPPTGALAPPAAPPFTATLMASRFGQGGQAILPSAYSNGLIPFDPATGALDPAFVSAFGFGNTPLTVQQFMQYWSSPSTSNGNFGTD
jgi:hypothetical protein